MKKALFFALFLGITIALHAQTKTEIDVKDLPKSISEFVSKSMTGFSIDKAFKVVEKGTQLYNVIVKKGDVSNTLVFDKDGNFIKKSEAEIKKGTLKKTDAVKIQTTTPSKSQ